MDKERKEKLQRALESGQRIIIDLSFADKMTGAEVRSMCQQLSYSYSANARATKPAHLILTSYEVSHCASYPSLSCSPSCHTYPHDVTSLQTR